MKWRQHTERITSTLAFLTLTAPLFATTVTPDEALLAAKAWAAVNVSFLGDAIPAGEPTPTIGKDGALLWYTVPFSGGASLVVAPDTCIEPVIAAIPHGDGALPPNHPLRILLESDLSNRLTVLKSTSFQKTSKVMYSASSPTLETPTENGETAPTIELATAVKRAEAKWTNLIADLDLKHTDGIGGSQSHSSSLVYDAGSDDNDPDSDDKAPDRVYAFIDAWRNEKMTHWHQSGANSYNEWNALYNLYTPRKYDCGCVATIGAALLQFFNITTPPNVTRTCMVDGDYVALTTMGGMYDWSILPQRWKDGISLTDNQKDLIGRVTYDMGVCLQMQYSGNGSGAMLSTLATVLRNDYGFADARYVQDVTADHYEKLIYEQVRCGYPVALSISNSSSGHAVLAVGYGEDADNTGYTRIFMGWGGFYDAWYALPNIKQFTSIDFVLTMIGTTPETVPLCGRVFSQGGEAMPSETVSCLYAPNHARSILTDDQGAWGTRVAPALPSSACKVSCRGTALSYAPVSIAPYVYGEDEWYDASKLCNALPGLLNITLKSTPVPGPAPEPSPDVCNAKLTPEDLADKPYATTKTVTLLGAAFDGCEARGIVQLKLDKVKERGGVYSSKVSGLFMGFDGKKRTIKAYKFNFLQGESVAAQLEIKGNALLSVTIGGLQFAGTLVDNDRVYHVQTIDAQSPNDWTRASAYLTLHEGVPDDIIMDFVPTIQHPEPVYAKNGKWVFDKAPTIKYAKVKPKDIGNLIESSFDASTGKGLVVDTKNNTKTNLSSLKLSYTPKNGYFKGSLKLYGLEGGKLKKYTMKANGVVVNGVGYGEAICSNPTIKADITIRE